MSTEHDTANQQMIHTFKNGCQLITDRRTKKAYLTSDHKVIEEIDTSEMLVEEYTKLVLNYEKTMI